MIQNADRKILVLWVIAVALITKGELDRPSSTPAGTPNPVGMPGPWAYSGSAMVYGLAAILAEFAGDLAVALAAGWTLYIAYARLGIGSGAGAKGTTAGGHPAGAPAGRRI